MTDKTDVHGPWGGSEGKCWVYMPKSFIKKIVIARGSYVYGIKFYSVETESSHFGVMEDDTQFDEICLKYPDEYLTSISGTVGTYEGVDVVMSLSFVTNQYKLYGPYGNENDGTPFSYTGEGVMIVGFHGRATVTGYLGAVGIYVMPVASAQDYMHRVFRKVVMARYAGPWGGYAVGKPWDDGVFSTVKRIDVYLDKNSTVIHAIRFEYLGSNGKSYLSPIHGGTRGYEMQTATLDVIDEYLTGVAGSYGYVNGVMAINSITFYSNKTRYGPYGVKYLLSSDVSFCSSTTTAPGKIVGFHGRDACYLTGIGAHIKYF